MSVFIVRVELHGALEGDYQVLHALMEKLGFSRSIVDSFGSRFQLPTAEYAINSTLTTEAIRDLVIKTAQSTGKSYWILVVQASDTGWFLKKIN